MTTKATATATKAADTSDMASSKVLSGPFTLTPAIAARWLEHYNYADNRPISLSRVINYARQMSNGLWKLNGEPIIFDKAGGMLNGQHRCAAVVKSKKTIKIMVTRGIDQATFTTMDQTYGRSGAQVMKMQGFKNASTRSAVCRALFMWETNNGSLKSSGKISPDELLLVQDVYASEVDEGVIFARLAQQEVPTAVGLLGLAHVLFRRARPRKAEEFLQVLEDGLTTSKGHPALVLRRRFITDKMKNVKMPYTAQWCAIVRAWNAYDKGQTLRTILVKRNPQGEWVQQAIRGLGKQKTGGKVNIK